VSQADSKGCCLATTAPRFVTRNMTDNDVVDVAEHDVLLGRGKRSNNWPGNIRFRKLVDAEQNAYMTASDDTTRDAIAFEIANAIERQGGRFLRETVVEVNGAPRSAWMVVEGATIRTKVKQALRDSAKAKSREENAIQVEGEASGEDRKPPAARSLDREVLGGTPADSKMAGEKRPRAAQQQQARQDTKRPAAAVPVLGPPAEASRMNLIVTSEADQRQQHMAHASQNPSLLWPLSQDPLPPPYGYTPDQQLRAALLEREQQQLSLLRTLAAEQQQQQQLLRLEEERRALAAALQMGLPAAARFFPSHLDSFSFRNFPIAPLLQQQQQPTAFVDQHLRVPTNQPSPTDTLAALRLRQTLDARQNLLGRQTMLDHQVQQALQLLRDQQMQQQQQLQLQFMAAVPPPASAATERPEEASMLQPPAGALGEPPHPPNRLLLQHPATARNDDSSQSSSEEDSEGSTSSSDGKEQATSKVGNEPGDDPEDLA
jgi:hypothetical protein